MIGKRVVGWLDDRLGTASFAKHALRKAFPDHWSFMLGEIAAYCFAILVATGVFLTFFFDASDTPVTYHGPYAPLEATRMSTAYDSALRLSFEVRAGLLFRQVHHWAAVIFVGAIVLHASRIFFTGAFRRPRELNWLVGATLLILAMGDGFTGYSLPDDLLSGTGLRIAYSMVLAVPLLGTWLAFIIFGGPFPSGDLLQRFFTLHILLIPGAIAAALVLHLTMVWHQKHTQFPGPGRTEENVIGSPLWPLYTMRSLGLGAMVAAVLLFMGGLLQINPIWLYGPYRAWQVTSPAQPDWYIGWADGSLRIALPFSPVLWGHQVSPLLWPLLGIAIGFLMLYAWPFIDRRITGDGRAHHTLYWPWQAPTQTGIGVGYLTIVAIITLIGSDDVQARYLHVAVEDLAWIYRWSLPILPPFFGFVAYWLCREIKERKEAEGGKEGTWITVRRSSDGGYEHSPEA
jgi:ubiquinol-cytochrome c reductase cytochrome b subunit